MSKRHLPMIPLFLCLASIAFAGVPSSGTDPVRVGAAITTKKATIPTDSP